jgi:hypothetical protein
MLEHEQTSSAECKPSIRTTLASEASPRIDIDIDTTAAVWGSR